jgi:hypothetical protein
VKDRDGDTCGPETVFPQTGLSLGGRTQPGE